MSDELFNREEFVSYFRDEAEELLQQIDGDLLKLEEFATSKETDPEIISSLFRALHTIKGSGGMLGFTDVQGLAHKLENLFDLLRKDQMPLSESCVDILFSGRDFLTDLVGIAVGGDPNAPVFHREDAFGVYSYLEAKLTRRYFPGFMFDYQQALDRQQGDLASYSPYFTIWLSEFQRVRLQYTYLTQPENHESQFFLQWTAVLGSHVHGFRDR